MEAHSNTPAVWEGFAADAHEHWRRHGYVVLRLLDDDQVAAALDNAYEYMPSWEEYRRTPRKFPEAQHGTAGGIGGISRHFPFVGDALNDISVHPALREVAEAILGTKRLVLTESQLIGKYADGHDFDQQLHLDYRNVTLAVPRQDDRAVDLTTITYYSEVTLELGPTFLVPQDYTRDLPRVPARRSRDESPDLYAHELPITLPAGATLVYSVNTWHRGSAMRKGAGARFSHHVGFRRSPSPWCGHSNFQLAGGSAEMDAFLIRAAPEARELAGFPPLVDPYWDETTIEDVGSRYPGMDMVPYRRAMGRSQSDPVGSHDGKHDD